MFSTHHSVIEAHRVTKRRHRIRLLVTTRPADATEYLDYYTAKAEEFAYEHNAKLVGSIDATFLPFTDSAILLFDVKEYKHPEKHPYVFDFSGRKNAPIRRR